VTDHRDVIVVGGNTGFQIAEDRPAHATDSLVHVPVFDEHGRVAHRRRVTQSPGLYFLGLPWQHTRGSALLGWVKDNAEHLARHIAASIRGKPSPARA
jgi:hypothetical protein